MTVISNGGQKKEAVGAVLQCRGCLVVMGMRMGVLGNDEAINK